MQPARFHLLLNTLDAAGQILRHDAGLDGGDADGFKRFTEASQWRIVVELRAV